MSSRSLARLLHSLRSDRSRRPSEPCLPALRAIVRITNCQCHQQKFGHDRECICRMLQVLPEAIHSLQIQFVQPFSHRFQISEDSPRESLLRCAQPEQIGEYSRHSTVPERTNVSVPYKTRSPNPVRKRCELIRPKVPSVDSPRSTSPRVPQIP